MLLLVLVSEIFDIAPLYSHEFWTPVSLFNWFTAPLPIKFCVFELSCFLLLVTTRNKRPVARPVLKAIYVSFGTAMFVTVYGLVTGGSYLPLYTLLHAWSFGLAFALTAMAVLSNADDFRQLDDAIVLAACWRSAWGIVFYLKVRNYDWSRLPSWMTTHEDSVLFSVALIVLVSRAIESRSKKSLRNLLLGTPLILMAMKVNNRRLVWATVIASLLIIYFSLPATAKVAKRINRAMRTIAPALALYVAIGWSNPTGVFKPLATLTSMFSGKRENGEVDLSTKARDNENFGCVTMMLERPILGTGFGHEWLEIDKSGTVPLTVFPMYHFSPHNSIMALLAFCGGLGLAGLWMVIPISIFLNTLVYRRSRDPTERTVAITGVTTAVAYLNQAYGDMGFIHPMPSILLGLSIASAARLSVTSGVWSRPGTNRARTIGNQPSAS